LHIQYRRIHNAPGRGRRERAGRIAAAGHCQRALTGVGWRRPGCRPGRERAWSRWRSGQRSDRAAWQAHVCRLDSGPLRHLVWRLARLRAVYART